LVKTFKISIYVYHAFYLPLMLLSGTNQPNKQKDPTKRSHQPV